MVEQRKSMELQATAARLLATRGLEKAIKQTRMAHKTAADEENDSESDHTCCSSGDGDEDGDDLEGCHYSSTNLNESEKRRGSNKRDILDGQDMCEVAYNGTTAELNEEEEDVVTTPVKNGKKNKAM